MPLILGGAPTAAAVARGEPSPIAPRNYRRAARRTALPAAATRCCRCACPARKPRNHSARFGFRGSSCPRSTSLDATLSTSDRLARPRQAVVVSAVAPAGTVVGRMPARYRTTIARRRAKPKISSYKRPKKTASDHIHLSRLSPWLRAAFVGAGGTPGTQYQNPPDQARQSTARASVRFARGGRKLGPCMPGYVPSYSEVHGMAKLEGKPRRFDSPASAPASAC